ncbi:hypothetical protein DM790_21215 [Flavobacterium collinsii]|nr:hypothetical protein [Flavobacterium collinsii]
MKKNYLLIKVCYLFIILLITSHNTWAQTSTETFETESPGSTSFTDNGVIFNILSHSSTFDIANFTNTGWSGTANDNRHIDNSGTVGTGASFSIKTTSNLFKVNRFWVFVANNFTNQNATGTLTITGKLSGITKFTQTKTTGFATSLGSTNGYTLIDMTNLNGQNYSNIIIDQLQITAGGDYAYLALDAFTWVKDNNNTGTTISAHPSSNTICSGANTSFSVTALNATSYQWQVSTDGSFTNISDNATYSGTTSSTLSITGATSTMSGYQYRCVVTGSGSVNSNPATLTVPVALASTVSSQTNVSTYGGNNGSATVSVSNGTSPYFYSWSSGGTAATANNLSAGTYTVTITDSTPNGLGGCTATQTVTITQPPRVTASVTSLSPFTSCNGAVSAQQTFTISGGSLTSGLNVLAPTGYELGLSAAGSYSSQIIFFPSAGTVNTTTIYARLTSSATGNPSGNITVSSTNAVTQNVAVTGVVTAAPVITTAPTASEICSGANTTFSVTTSNATGYQWQVDQGNNVFTDISNNALYSGVNTATLNITGVPGTMNGFKYRVLVKGACSPDATSNSAVLNVNHINVALSKVDIACFGTSTGQATAAPSGGTGTYTYSWSNGADTPTITGLIAGTYTVTVTDENSCSNTATVTIGQPSSALTLTQGTISNTSCYGGGNGTANVAANGGTPGYTYSWNTTPVQTTATATGLKAGTYTVTVKDANQCTKTLDFTINQPPSILITPSQTNVSCNGGTNGTATATVSGGTGTYTYSWSPSGGTEATATGLAAGTYTVTITDANNCQTTRSYTIDQPSALTATQSQTDVLCNGSATGTATVIASGGTGHYSYTWSPSGGTAATATGLIAGNYTCTIKDQNNCIITKSFTITQPSYALSATQSQINATCSTGGQAAVSVSGGTLSYSYLWFPSGATTAIATGLTAGNHSVLITDGNGCTLTKNFTIDTTNTLAAVQSKTDVLCNGSNTGSATVIPAGAPGPFTYVWSPSVGNSATVNNLTAGNYAVTITSANGCSIVKNFTITEPSALTITPGPQANVTCNGGSNGSLSATVTGGTGAYNYSWAPSGGSAATANGLSAGTYTLTVKDANLCTKTQSFTITEPPLLTASTSQTNVSCKDGSNGTATVNVTGGTGTYTYSWAPYGGTNATASGLAAGNYIVTIKDANLCMTTAAVTITEPDQLTAAIYKTDVLCNSANNGTATVTASGGTGTYTYSWSPSGGTAATATGLSPNTYSVTVTDSNGCFVTETVQITEPTALSIIDSQTNVSCNSGNNGSASVTVSGGTGPYTYSWSQSGGTAATATGLSAGIYTVTATDSNSCSISRTITITEPDVLATNITVTDVTCHNGNNGSAAITAAGGTAPYTYLWPHNGATASSATGLTAGIYEVILTDSNSCSLSTSIEIKQPENPVNLNTASVSEITVSGAKLSGTVSSDGINTDKGECLTEVGFVYALHTNPTATDTKINVTVSLGDFTGSLSNLRGNRTYYVRTYAVNSNGFINYGNEVSFTTEKYTLNINAFSGHTKVYGTSDPVFNYTATGFANGDTNTIIMGQLSRETGENVGKYNITQGNISAGADYTIVFTAAEFEITKANQTITWNQTLEFGCDDSTVINLNATADSGLTVSYTIANSEIGTINESTLTILNSGSTTITAVQNGDQNHNPAVAVIKPIEVSQSGLITQQWADVLLFDNKSNSFTSYQWYKNGNAVSGATRQYYSENQPLNGTYYVIARNTNGSSIKSCPIETTGTAFSKNLKIHPNPVRPTNEFTLECDFSESQLNGAEITIFDITGKLVQTITNVKAQNQITAPSQAAIYVVVLSLSNGQKKTINLLVK